MEAYEVEYENLETLFCCQRRIYPVVLQSIKDACGPKPEQPNALAYVTAFIAYGLYGWVEEWFQRGVQKTPKELVALYEHTKHSDSQQ